MMMMQGGMPPMMSDDMMPGGGKGGPDEGQAGLKPPTEIGEDEDFLFENFLKQGEY
jgi:hypothetical protein